MLDLEENVPPGPGHRPSRISARHFKCTPRGGEIGRGLLLPSLAPHRFPFFSPILSFHGPGQVRRGGRSRSGRPMFSPAAKRNEERRRESGARGWVSIRVAAILLGIDANDLNIVFASRHFIIFKIDDSK